MTTGTEPRPGPPIALAGLPSWLVPTDEDSLAFRLGIRLDEASAEYVAGSMPVAGNRQLHGLLHGGASAAFAETLGSIGAALHAGSGRMALGVDLNATHHRAARQGRVTGTATALYLGDATASYEIVVADHAGQRLCTARLTCAIRSRGRRGREPGRPRGGTPPEGA